MRHFFSNFGNWFLTIVDQFMSLCAYNIRVLRILIEKKPGASRAGWRIFSKQVLFTGVDALPLIAMVSLAIGGISIIQSLTFLPRFGAESLIGKLLVTVIIRELGPILTGFIVIGRSGTAITTEIGNMVVSHEIEALEAMGVDPIRYIVIPRIFGVTFSLVSLNIYFNIFALIGGFLVSKLILVTSFSVYFGQILKSLVLSDVVISLSKGFIFGVLISLLCTFQGFAVRLSSTEVPQMTTKAVVYSIAAVFLADGIITFIYYI
jgi:phospholipid/cholesterol/gamma-HCH transport system permease protein